MNYMYAGLWFVFKSNRQFDCSVLLKLWYDQIENIYLGPTFYDLCGVKIKSISRTSKVCFGGRRRRNYLGIIISGTSVEGKGEFGLRRNVHPISRNPLPYFHQTELYLFNVRTQKWYKNTILVRSGFVGIL